MLPEAMTRAEVLAELLDPPRRAFVPHPNTQVVVRPGWRQLITPSLARGLNQVSLAQLENENDNENDESIDATIDATLAQYRGVRFAWRVGPDSSPANLGERLLRRGLTHELTYGMARTPAISSDPDAGQLLRSIDGVDHDTVELVDRTTLDTFTTTMETGWKMDAGSLTEVNACVFDHGPPHYLWLARLDGEPAATAASVLFPRSAYLLGGVTLEHFRGRGAYRALVTRRLAHARAHGVPLATTIARADTSAPILERLGFERICRFDNYIR
jgi:hypothetical protein